MEQRRKTQRTQTIRYLVSLLLYGTNGVAAHFLQLSSMQIVLLRTSFGWLVLTLALLLGQKTRQSAQRQDVLFVLLSGMCMAADWLLFREKLGAVSWCALALSFFGAVLISLEAAGTIDAAGCSFGFRRAIGARRSGSACAARGWGTICIFRRSRVFRCARCRCWGMWSP